MRTRNLSRNILLILALPVFFFACNDEQEEKAFELQVDAYIVKKKFDGETMFANAYFAYGNKAIESATVTPPASAGDPVGLVASVSTPSVFFREPETEDFTNMFPAQGEYLFDVESRDGEVLQQSDMMEAGILEVPEITETTFHADTESMTVSWDSAYDADGFVLKLLNENDKVIYISYLLLASTEEYQINQVSGNWDGVAYFGENYTLQVQAVTYESGATEDDRLYNIREVAIGEMEITWGPEEQ